MGKKELLCQICNKAFLRSESEIRKKKAGHIYCSHTCRKIGLKGESNPNSKHQWSEEKKRLQSAKLKAGFANGRRVWNKGLTKADPRVAQYCEHLTGNTNGRFTKGQKRPDDIWRNVFNSSGVRYGLQEIHKYKYHAKLWMLLRREVLERDRNECQHCGATGQLVVHHQIPVRMGGKDESSNLITLCRVCHGREEAKARERHYSNGGGHRKVRR